MCVLEVDERRHANHDVLGYPGKAYSSIGIVFRQWPMQWLESPVSHLVSKLKLRSLLRS